MLEADLDEAEIYRRQLDFAVLTRHDTGCSIAVTGAARNPVPSTSAFEAMS